MARAAELPKWAWDLVIAIEKHEDEHPTDGACLKPLLALIPLGIRDQAAAIRSYAQVATHDVALQAAARAWDDMMTTLEPEAAGG